MMGKRREEMEVATGRREHKSKRRKDDGERKASCRTSDYSINKPFDSVTEAGGIILLLASLIA